MRGPQNKKNNERSKLLDCQFYRSNIAQNNKNVKITMVSLLKR